MQAGGIGAIGHICPSAAPCLEPARAWLLVRPSAVAQPHAQFLYALDTPDSGRQVGAEVTAVCGFVRQGANRLQPDVDRRRGEKSRLQMQPVVNDHRLIEGRAIPVHEFVDGVAIAPLRIWAR